MNKCPDIKTKIKNIVETLKDLDGSQGHEALKCYYYTTLSGLASQNSGDGFGRLDNLHWIIYTNNL